MSTRQKTIRPMLSIAVALLAIATTQVSVPNLVQAQNTSAIQQVTVPLLPGQLIAPFQIANTQATARTTQQIQDQAELMKQINRRRNGQVPLTDPQDTTIDPPVAALSVNGSNVTNNTPGLIRNFDGLNILQSEQAQPPDQGLCVGGGYIVETVNSAVRVFRPNGNVASNPVSLSAFYGLPTSSFIFDPSCHFDPDTGRFFHIAATIEATKTYIDIAVSSTNNPLGTWQTWRLPAHDDGTDGTPNHQCHGPCFGDYPHMGVDKYGLYIAANEARLSNGTFRGALVYAISKRQLTMNSPGPSAIQFSQGALAGRFGGTLAPTTVPVANFDLRNNGTQYFLSSGDTFSGVQQRLALWALINTASLDAPYPALQLLMDRVRVNPYDLPLPAEQKPGPIPLAQCMNDTTLPTPNGPGCWRLVLSHEPPHSQIEPTIDSSDGRVKQAVFAQNLVWSVFETATSVGGAQKTGVAYFILSPQITNGNLIGTVVNQGVIAVANNHVINPAIAVLSNGHGVIAMNLVGPDHYPTAAYAMIDAGNGVGNVHITAPGVGPYDSSTGYDFGNGAAPARWGDYAAATVDAGGDTIWLGIEYIGQVCTYQQYLATQFTCGDTRGAYGNWYTRIMAVRP